MQRFWAHGHVRHTLAGLVLVFFVLTGVATGTQVLFCHDATIQGYEDQALRAHDTVLTRYPVTRDVHDLAIYVTSTNGHDLYIHSNYEPPGYRNPTKIVFDDGRSAHPAAIDDAIVNLVLPSGNGGDPTDDEAMVEEMRSSIGAVPVFVDAQAFTHDGFLDRRFGALDNVSVVGDTGEPQKLWLLDLDDRRVPAFEAAPGLYGRLDDKQQLLDALSLYSDRRFDRSEIRVVSLFGDEETNQVAASKFGRQFLGADVTSAAGLRARLASARGDIVYILGHVEDGQFVVQSALGTPVFSIALDKVLQIGNELGVEVRPVGCQSGAIVGTGPIDSYNSIWMLNRIDAAASNSSTQLEFLAHLADPQVRVLFDSSSFYKTGQVKVRLFYIAAPAAAIGLGYVILANTHGR